jgi:general secretion pathway protein J
MNRHQSGFTLIEILIAVVITVLLLSTVYEVFNSVSAARDRLEAAGQSYSQARVILDRIGREIRGLYFLPGDPQTRFAGGETSDGDPYLELSTTATTPQGGNAAAQTGLSLVRYELAADPETKDGRKVLLRSESSLFQPTDKAPKAYRLATAITGMKVRFYSNGTWKDSWKGDSLPDMVEVRLTVQVGKESVPFATAFAVNRVEALQ